jgi:hypothetical protein
MIEVLRVGQHGHALVRVDDRHISPSGADT